MTLAQSQHPSPALPRITLIDTLRGVALLAMASYHFTWDLEFFGYLDPGTATQGWWKIYARAIASSFLFLAGVSLVLAHYPDIRWRAFWKRFAMVAGAAAAISIATLIALPNEWIFFGILHSIAIASLIGLAFIRLPPLVSGSAAALLVILLIVDSWIAPGSFRSEVFNARYLSWIGLFEQAPRSNDFVPLFPWLAALLGGIAITRVAMQRNWLIALSRVQTRPNLLARAGKHSLIIYLLHQPVLIAIVYIMSMVVPPAQPDPRQSYMRACESGCVTGGNGEALCRSFCDCTADALQAQSLIEALQDGSINPNTDDRVLRVAHECAIVPQ
ncbi:MAG: heparan-alpha-glucosaminide N-acetyltransferase [Pseudorhizobium sp.]